MIKRKFLFIALVLLLISVGVVFAQSSPNYQIQRFSLTSGGVSESAHYKVDAVIGQPATGNISGANHIVSAGFLYRSFGSKHTVNLPIVIRR
jgi:hypothetical protein